VDKEKFLPFLIGKGVKHINKGKPADSLFTDIDFKNIKTY
jgi:hypothetical protein